MCHFYDTIYGTISKISLDVDEHVKSAPRISSFRFVNNIMRDLSVRRKGHALGFGPILTIRECP